VKLFFLTVKVFYLRRVLGFLGLGLAALRGGFLVSFLGLESDLLACLRVLGLVVLGWRLDFFIDSELLELRLVPELDDETDFDFLDSRALRFSLDLEARRSARSTSKDFWSGGVS